MRNRVALILFVVACLAHSNCVLANPITYTDQVIGSGKLGATTFTDALVTVTFTGDTSNVIPGSGFVDFIITVGTATVNVQGVGTATLINDNYAAAVSETFQ